MQGGALSRGRSPLLTNAPLRFAAQGFPGEALAACKECGIPAGRSASWPHQRRTDTPAAVVDCLAAVPCSLSTAVCGSRQAGLQGSRSLRLWGGRASRLHSSRQSGRTEPVAVPTALRLPTAPRQQQQCLPDAGLAQGLAPVDARNPHPEPPNRHVLFKRDSQAWRPGAAP